jgi:hypothetical protein
VREDVSNIQGGLFRQKLDFFDNVRLFQKKFLTIVGLVPDKRSQILEVVVVRRIFNLGTGNLEWGGNGKGLRKGRSVYE